MEKKLKISILIPCYNEELTIERCVFSCLNQTRPADEIIIVDDSSKDNTHKILRKFGSNIKLVKTPRNTGNKSYAQEYGLQFVTGDYFITTDGDTLLDKDFIKNIEKDLKHPSTVAVSGYVRSLKYNWLTACRALDYSINQNIDKLAQDYLDSIFVIPGAAGAFKTSVFKEQITFDHDTITEDLDFTYRLHELGYTIKFNRKAICYTQDPTDLKSYINQMRRWFGGVWQNFLKHFSSTKKPGMAMELALMYTEGLIYSFLMFLMPLVNFRLSLFFMTLYLIPMVCLAIFASIKERRIDLLSL